MHFAMSQQDHVSREGSPSRVDPGTDATGMTRVVDANEQIGERASKAIEMVAEVSKQVLTLSAGILAVTVTFAKDLAHDAGGLGRLVLSLGWLALLLSSVLGLLLLLNNVGILSNPKAEPLERGAVWDRGGAGIQKWQIYFFLAGVAAVVVFGTLSYALPKRSGGAGSPPAEDAAGPFVKDQTVLLKRLANEDRPPSQATASAAQAVAVGSLWRKAQTALQRTGCSLAPPARAEMNGLFVHAARSKASLDAAQRTVDDMVATVALDARRRGSTVVTSGFSGWLCGLFPNLYPWCANGRPMGGAH